MLNQQATRRSVLAGLLAGITFPFSSPSYAEGQEIVFLSVALRAIEEAQKVRQVILRGAPVPVNFVTEVAAQLPVRLQAEQQAGRQTVSLVAAAHGELQSLVPIQLLDPIDDVVEKLASRGIPKTLLDLGKFGTNRQLYVPWMQATYFMAANKKALQYLPNGADLNALTYEHLAQWASSVHQATGQRLLGFPAGPQGLISRLFQGYLYPSFTGSAVSAFRSEDAAGMWAWFKRTWADVNPSSTNYGFMQEPLLAGEVWIAWDHVARLLDALRERPDDFVTFPAPAGPKGRGYMPVLIGLAIPPKAPDRAGAVKTIEFLSRPETQITTAVETGFFPVVHADLPADMPPGVRLAADAISKTMAASDALPSLLPVGLGDKNGEFNKIYVDTFQRIVLHDEPIRRVLDQQADSLRAIMKETAAPCWSPDPPSQGACPVK